MNSTEDVSRLAGLARISVSEKELPVLAKEFEGILAYISQLNELDLGAVKDIKSLPARRNVFREDAQETKKGTWTEKIVQNFPARSGNLLSVKKIISHD